MAKMNKKKHKELSDLIIYSLTRKTGKKEVLIGEFPKKLKKQIEKKGLILPSLKVYVDSFAIRHAFKKHGVKSKRISKGEIPVCVFDILLLPDLIKDSNILTVEKDVIKISKNEFGLIGEIVCELRISKRKGNRIYLKTMYNKKRGVKAPFSNST